MICPKCKGKGETRRKPNLFLAVITIGMTALMEASQWETCPICEGKGIIIPNPKK